MLVWSLRKSADGLAAKWINRHISLRISWLLMRTPVHPNHITIAALAVAILGAVAIARGAAVWGFLLVNFGSIIDGCDGELARLRCQFSRTGQWLDTVADDLANVAYATGLAFHLQATGSSWAMPVASGALLAFASTQLTQYGLLRFVYRSGDLAAIPWAMQSTEVLSGRGLRSFVPKLFKRDFVLVVMLVLAITGRLDAALVLFAAGAAVFAAMFWTQLARYAFGR
jgi:phosphatidylglycerophosphate synthase